MRAQSVAQTTLGLNYGRAQLFAQAADVHFNRVAFDFGVKCVELFFQLRLGQNLTRAGQKRFKKRPFAGGQADGCAIMVNAAGSQINFKRAMGDDRVWVALITPPHRSDPG